METENIMDELVPTRVAAAETTKSKPNYKNYAILCLAVLVVILILYIYFTRGKEEPTVNHYVPPPVKSAPPPVENKTVESPKAEEPKVEEKTMVKELMKTFPPEEEENGN
jgi:hypothetical protein